MSSHNQRGNGELTIHRSSSAIFKENSERFYFLAQTEQGTLLKNQYSPHTNGALDDFKQKILKELPSRQKSFKLMVYDREKNLYQPIITTIVSK